jgi:GTPase SAR1 family protein
MDAANRPARHHGLREIAGATKCDKETKVISSVEGLKLATKFNMTFFETSAQTGLGVNEAFEHIVKSCIKKQTPGGPKLGVLNSTTNKV